MLISHHVLCNSGWLGGLSTLALHSQREPCCLLWLLGNTTSIMSAFTQAVRWFLHYGKIQYKGLTLLVRFSRMQLHHAIVSEYLDKSGLTKVGLSTGA